MPSDPPLSATILASDPPPAVSRTPMPPSRDVLERGASVGRYVILDPIGAGGMGVVYRAYDPELDRRLAVKVLRPTEMPAELDSEGRARLLREGQAMARLSHPNVIAVHDVGTHAGQVFIAMELVEGETLRTWLETPRAWPEIVAMFVQAARGLAAAHDAGIVHRDFKGDNVLVGKDGRARVLDFGLAHAPGAIVRTFESAALTQPHAYKVSSLETPLTQDGVLLGTPRYMAPEQMAGIRTDATADQFSFCVALYEGLYGEPPFEGNDFITLSANVLSGKMRAVPTGRAVPSWVRAILGRGLSVKAPDRYPSMHALIAALERDPAAARRRWTAVAGAAIGVALVTVGLVELRAHRPVLCPSAQPEIAAVWGDAQVGPIGAAFRATKKPYADDALAGVKRALDAYSGGWVAMHDETCAATRIRGSQSAELMDLRMACLEDRLAGLRALTAQLARADAATVERSIVAADSLQPVSSCADVAALRAPGLPGDPEARKRIEDVRAQIASAQVLSHTSKPIDAIPAAEAAVAAAKITGYRPLEAEALETLGTTLDLKGDEKRAIPTLDEALLAAEAGHHESLQTQVWIDLVHADGKDERMPEGRVAAKHAHSLLERDGASNEAREATLLLNEAALASDEGHHQDALDTGKRALAIRERLLPPDHPDIADCLNQLGNVALSLQDFPAGLAYHQRALAIREKALGPAHPAVGISLNNIGNALAQMGKIDEAIVVYKRALEVKIAAFGEDSLTVANTLGVLGMSYTSKGSYRDALDAMDRALAIRQHLLPPDHLDLARSYGQLVEPQLALHRWDEAIESATKDITLEEHALGADSPFLAAPLSNLGLALLGKGDAKGALPVMERAMALANKREGSPLQLGGTKETLARALQATHGDPARVRSLVADARATYVSMGDVTKLDLARLDGEFPGR